MGHVIALLTMLLFWTSTVAVELIGDPVEHPMLLDILRFWIDRLGMSVDCRMRRVAVAEAGDYVDRSRNGLRRWCQMRTCGTREKSRRRRVTESS